ncbi:MAG TPA: response regulator [Verrucomicrobiae bacterium]|jgi:PAS domain S-box-containing protein|nr:response regulator [Verrucomicrobiae bacterium]
MKRRITILLLEDNATDSDLVEAMLQRAGFVPDIVRVLTENDFKLALLNSNPDLIISDYSLPSYSGKAALMAAQKLNPEIPFIFYSGTIGEEAAIDALRLGATDYVLKDKPKRLVSTVERALEAAEQKTSQREAEEKIRAQALLLDLATDAIMVLDLEDRIQFWNEGAERLYGYPPAEVIGKRSTELMPLTLSAPFDEAKRSTLADGHWEGEMEHATKEQKPVLVTSRWTLVKNEKGEPERILAINTDITEKKQLEKQFLRAQRLESIGTLASGIAHDLNNILAPIFMASEILESQILPSDAAAMVDMIKRSAQRGAEIVKQVLTFVRGSDGQRISLKVDSLLKEIGKVCRDTFPKNIKIAYPVQGDLLPVRADPSQLHQVFMNLCINARDAMPNGGKLTINARNLTDESGSRVAVEVEDTGIGIPSGIIDKIFDPFFTTKDPGKGTGLGLSTVMGIVKSHGGTLKVESKEGAGTRFQVVFPANAESDDDESDTRFLPVPPGKGEVILLVEDEEQIRNLIAHSCTAHGYKVLLAPDGASGVVQFVRNKLAIRVVITDIMMPGVDGASLANTIRTMHPSTRIIAISGVAEQAAVPEADRLLRKPFSTEELLRAIHQLLA